MLVVERREWTAGARSGLEVATFLASSAVAVALLRRARCEGLPSRRLLQASQILSAGSAASCLLAYRASLRRFTPEGDFPDHSGREFVNRFSLTPPQAHDFFERKGRCYSLTLLDDVARQGLLDIWCGTSGVMSAAQWRYTRRAACLYPRRTRLIGVLSTLRYKLTCHELGWSQRTIGADVTYLRELLKGYPSLGDIAIAGSGQQTTLGSLAERLSWSEDAVERQELAAILLQFEQSIDPNSVILG